MPSCIIQQLAQTGQLNADGGLRQVQDLGGTGDVPFSQQGVERDEQIQVDAAQDAVNLAAVVEDGSMVRVPTVDEAARGTAEVLAEESAGSGKVDLNRADKEALMRLPGVGERKAEQILAYRKEHGKFKSTEEIKKIPGIKEKAFEKLKDSITVSE